MPKKLTQADFLARAVAVHGLGRYDYSQTVYVCSTVKVNIICPEHGAFKQAPATHIRGTGCAKCGHIVQSAATIKGKAYYVAIFQKKHGLRYDYFLVPEAFKAKAVLNIICPIHGVFQQVADKHRLHGCSRCTKSLGPIKSISAKEFREVATSVHGTRYHYPTLPASINRTHYVDIACPLHGEFKQLCYYHLGGGGCDGCAWVDKRGNRNATLYFLRIFAQDEEFFKVGITYDSIEKRYKNGRSLMGYQYEVLALSSSPNAAAIWGWEQSILGTFAHLRYKPKKPFAGQTECFSSADEILSIFPL